MPVYLDYSATAPPLPEVLEAMIEVLRNNYGNAGSRTHIFGQRANEAVEQARKQIGAVLGVEKSDVIFTSGATESNNIAILGLAQWGAENGKRHIVSTAIEHKAVLEPLAHLAQRGFEVELVPVDHTGRVRVEDVLSRVREDTLMVSVMHANNETGVVQPIKAIGDELAKTSAYFHVDGAQSFGKLVDALQDCRYDLLSVSGHKIYGPQGIGALVRKPRRLKRPPIKPIAYGGGQERGLRPGTLPVALIVGFAVAAEVAHRNHPQWLNSCLDIKRSIVQQLELVRYEINGTTEHSLGNCLNISFTGVDSEALMIALKDHYAFSNGSACTSSSYTPSHVLTAMGLDQQRVDSALRISWGPSVTSVDLQPLVDYVRQVAPSQC